MFYYENWNDVVAQWELLEDDTNFDPCDERMQEAAVSKLTPKELAKALEDVRGCECCVDRGRLLKDAVIERILVLLEGR